jgi:hypothetical protein
VAEFDILPNYFVRGGDSYFSEGYGRVWNRPRKALSYTDQDSQPSKKDAREYLGEVILDADVGVLILA